VTADGGATWTRSLYVNDRNGAIDLVMDPSDPKILYASPWQIGSGPESGIYKTTDAGRTWTKLGNGLPAGPLGRSNLDVRPVRLAWQPGREVPPLPPRGRALLHVWLKAASEVQVAIRDADSRGVRTMTARGAAGVNRVEWDAANMRFPNLPAADQYLTKDYRAGWKLA